MHGHVHLIVYIENSWKTLSFGKFRFLRPFCRLGYATNHGITRASYRSNCRRGGKIVVIIRRKGHSPQMRRNRRRVSGGSRHPKRTSRPLTEVHAVDSWQCSLLRLGFWIHIKSTLRIPKSGSTRIKQSYETVTESTATSKIFL